MPRQCARRCCRGRGYIRLFRTKCLKKAKRPSGRPILLDASAVLLVSGHPLLRVDERLKSPLGEADTPGMRPLPDVPSDPAVEPRLELVPEVEEVEEAEAEEAEEAEDTAEAEEPEDG